MRYRDIITENEESKKDKLDRFYTKDSVAKECISLLLKYTPANPVFVEPSAGGGAFFRQLPGQKIGVDLAPAIDGVIQHDYLTFNIPKDCIIVGNPPFGVRNKLTNEFIRHSIAGGAAMIAFVLPKVYRKGTMQGVFPEDWVLLKEVILPDDSFVFEGKPYHVPSVFQIWSRIHGDEADERMSRKEVKSTSDFEFVTRKEATHFVFGTTPFKVIPIEDVLPNNRGYFVKFGSDSVIDTFKKIDWKNRGNSSVSGGVSWFSKQEIIDNYVDFTTGE